MNRSTESGSAINVLRVHKPANTLDLSETVHLATALPDPLGWSPLYPS